MMVIQLYGLLPQPVMDKRETKLKAHIHASRKAELHAPRNVCGVSPVFNKSEWKIKDSASDERINAAKPYVVMDKRCFGKRKRPVHQRGAKSHGAAQELALGDVAP